MTSKKINVNIYIRKTEAKGCEELRTEYDYSELRGRIKRYFGNQQKFAKYIAISNTSLSQKLNNRVYFTQEEMEKSVLAFDAPYSDINALFFTHAIRKTERGDELKSAC